MVDECFSGGETLSIELVSKRTDLHFWEAAHWLGKLVHEGRLKIVFRKDGRKAIKTLYYVRA